MFNSRGYSYLTGAPFHIFIIMREESEMRWTVHTGCTRKSMQGLKNIKLKLFPRQS